MFATRDRIAELTRSAWLFVPLCALSLVLPGRVAAQTAEREAFQHAREAYNRGAYHEVVDLLEPLVGAALPVSAMRSDPVLVRESRKYLGAAYVLTSQEGAAERQFEALLRAEGEDLARYRLNAAVFPSSVQAAFQAVQTRLVEEQRAREAALEAETATRERERREALMSLYLLAQEDVIEVENSPYMPLLPFGGGQFQMGNEELGWFFALSEALTSSVATISLFSYFNLLTERDRILLGEISGDLTGLSNALTTLIAVNWVSVGVTAVLMIAGLIEGYASYRPTTTERRRREVPLETQDRLQLVAGPGGVGLRF
ncbi:MAG: hypothetical protein AB8I08_10945 [Sandaracinaceae bacterium]